jgi:3-dehydroquinate synthase
MSVLFEINSSIKSYQVEILAGCLHHELARPDQSFVLIDEYLLKLYPSINAENGIAIPATEESKTLDTVGSVIENLRTLGANRDGHLVAIGGGVIQDVATFSASTYMRGIPWTYYPTTLLGMVDSCVGGKSSINVGQYKNIAGNFYPPEKIIIHTDFCNTLPRSEVIAGLCEAVKICFADTDTAFDQYLTLTEVVGSIHQDVLAEIIELTLRTKKKFIEEDEFDQGVRLLLNFGHTFGHAIEAASHFSITHGVAVGVGMLVAIDMSEKINPQSIGNPRVQALFNYVRQLLNGVTSLAEDLAKLSSEEALNKFKSDKKHRQHEYAIIVPDANGYLCRQFIPINDHSNELVKSSFEYIKAVYEV